LNTISPNATRIGLSATVAHPDAIAAYVGPNAARVTTQGGAAPQIAMMLPQGRLPWSGHMGLSSAPDILSRIRAAGTTIVFVNTRAQAELIFQELWKINAETLPIAIHHGSLELSQRLRVEAAMAEG